MVSRRQRVQEISTGGCAPPICARVVQAAGQIPNRCVSPDEESDARGAMRKSVPSVPGGPSPNVTTLGNQQGR
jgi:hypothetical protein